MTTAPIARRKTKMANLAKISRPDSARLARLERKFINFHLYALGAVDALRLSRVRAGRILLELKSEFSHGQWLAYLNDLCERQHIAMRTARRYLHDAQIAERIPPALLAEADRRGFNSKTRKIRTALIEYLVKIPDCTFTPKEIVDTLIEWGDLKLKVSSTPPLAPDEKTSCEEGQKEGAAAPAETTATSDEFAKWKSAKKTRARIAHELIDAGYRVLCKKYHPDTGGTGEQFLTLQNVKEWIEGQVFHPANEFGEIRWK